MNAKWLTSNYAFTGNPIILESDETAQDLVRGASFSVSYEGTEVYAGRFSPPLDIDIAEIADSVVEYLPEPVFDGVDPVTKIRQVGPMWNTNRIDVTVDYGHTSDKYTMIALKGGVSKQNFRRYAQGGKDVFQSRFVKEGNNVFLTTRTSDDTIEMKETEIYPLYFILGGEKGSTRLRIRDVLSGDENLYELSDGVYAFDPERFRWQVLEERGTLGNIIDIYVEEVFSCRIVITHCDPVKERYRLKFRNSLGVFEMMDISGTLGIQNEGQEEENEGYRRFDKVTRSFLNYRDRVEFAKFFTIETPLPSRNILWLMDMVNSDEIYLLDATASPIRVNVSATDVNFRHKNDIPQRVKLELRPVESELYLTEDFENITSGSSSRIHSEEFSQEFN